MVSRYSAPLPTGYFFHARILKDCLLLSVGAFFASRRGNWPLAGWVGGAAALTRTPGLLLPALLVEWYSQPVEEHEPATGGPGWD